MMNKTLLINLESYFMREPDKQYNEEYWKKWFREQRPYIERYAKHYDNWKANSKEFLDCHKITMALLGTDFPKYQAYQKKFHSTVWTNLFNNNLSHAFIIVRNATKQTDDAISIACHCYFNGITCYICSLEDGFRLVRSEPPKTKDGRIITLCINKDDARDYTDWNKQSRIIRQQLMDNSADCINVKEQSLLSNEIKQLSVKLNVDIPDDMLLIERTVRLDAIPYEVGYCDSHHHKYDNKPTFLNEGKQDNHSMSKKERSMHTTYEQSDTSTNNWKCLYQNSIQETKRTFNTEELLRQYVFIMYYKTIGIIPDTTTYRKCECCGQWYYKGTEHCPDCDIENPEYRPEYFKDYQYETLDDYERQLDIIYD